MSHVDLKDFVTQTLRDIVEGIQEAQQIEGVGGLIGPSGIGGHYKFSQDSNVVHEGRITTTVVKFDVAVTAENKKSGKVDGKAKIFVFEAGSEGALSKTDTTVSRIQFSVPIVMPKNLRNWSIELKPPKEHEEPA